VLVVDDDAHIREIVCFALERAGHQVAEVPEGGAAWDAFERERPDVIVLDVVMPGQDGLELCRRIRQVSSVPILFLSSRDDELDRVLGLELGGDDYVTKPFSPRELVARVKVLLRRSTAVAPAPGEPAVLRHGPLLLDPERHLCAWSGAPVLLSATEFLLLRSLLAAPLRVFSRAELVERAYGHGHHITERTVDSHIRRIRKKFAALQVDPVETIYGVGYRMRSAE
jgi:two-component system OmpR family response regulator